MRTVQASPSNVGAQGFAGLGVWRFRTEIVSPPNAGQIRFNNANIAAATILWIHETNDGGTDVGSFLNLIDPGDLIYIQDKGNSDNFVVVQVTNLTDQGTYSEVTIATIVQEGAAFGQQDRVGIIVSVAGGLTSVDLQTAYNTSAGAPQIIVTAAKPFSVRDNATPIGALLDLQDNAGLSFFNVAPNLANLLGAPTRRGFEIVNQATGRAGIRFLPDDRTQTVIPIPNYALQWDSIFTSNIPGGGGIGNDTAPALVGAVGECIFADNGNLFSSSLLFNQGTLATLQANIGPIYTLVNQPTIRADGGVFTCSQHNAVRAQPRIGPNINGGSITQNTVQLFFCTAIVDATVGSASITTLDYFVATTPTLTAGGTIGTLNAINLQNIIGPTVINGIRSVMNNGTFINHTGNAPSIFGGTGRVTFNGRVDINNPTALGGGVAATLGTIGGAGPTAAAQAQWIEVDVGGVPHWIPAWT